MSKVRTKPSANIVNLSGAASVLRAKYGSSPSYRRLWELVVSGELPAEQLANTRYIVDVDVIAEKLGLVELEHA